MAEVMDKILQGLEDLAPGPTYCARCGIQIIPDNDSNVFTKSRSGRLVPQPVCILCWYEEDANPVYEKAED